MGRQAKEFTLEDEMMMMELSELGVSRKEMAGELMTSVEHLNKKLASIQERHGVITQYRSVQALELTEIQCRLLDAITPEKIEDAPLRDIVMAYKVLKEKELLIDGKPTEIKGLLGYLIMLEKEELAAKNPIGLEEPSVDVEFTSVSEEEDEDES